MLQWADTMNRYGTSTALMLNGIYAEIHNATLIADPDPTSTQKVLHHVPNTDYNELYRFAFPGGSKATMGFQTNIWCDQLPTLGSFLPGWEFRDSANVAQVSISIETTGAMSIRRGGVNGAVLDTTTVPVVTANAWHRIEVKATINSATGSVEIRVNGSSVLTVTGANTQSSALSSSAQIAYSKSYSGGINTSHKNLAVWDTTGTYNNNFLGSVQMTDIDTNADTSLTWTPSTGTVGWSILDNNPPVDTTYVSAASVLSNIFGLGNLPADATSVKGLILVNRSWKIDGGDGNTQMGIVSGASTGLGTDRPITTAPTYWWDVMEVDPATSIPFTPTGFNAASLKQSRTV